jgi:hypothetical protein
MKQIKLQTANWFRGDELVRRLLDQNKLGLGNFAVLRGQAGSGKTFWAQDNVERENGVFVRGRQTWGTSTTGANCHAMLSDLLGVTNPLMAAPYDVHALYSVVAQQLDRRRASYVVVDEADYLVLSQKFIPLVNVLRDMSDETGIGFLLISVTRVAERIEAEDAFVETVKSRIVAQEEFLPPSRRDAMMFARELVEEIIFEPDLVAWCLETVQQSLRPLIRLYGQIEAAAKAQITGALSFKRAVEIGLEPVIQLVAAQNQQDRPKPPVARTEESKKAPLKVVQARA